MTDDLTSTGVDEPYRMFTSRAEYRLILLEDNAMQRLAPQAVKLGLLSEEAVSRFQQKQEQYDRASRWLQATRVKPTQEANEWLAQQGTAALKDSVTLAQLLKRPQIKIDALLEFESFEEPLSDDLKAALEIECKFSGYLDRQEEDVKKLRKIESEKIPSDFPYDSVLQLRTEAREKLKKHRPDSIGQAMRIPGMTPSTISLLAVYLKRYRSGELAAS